MFEEAQPEQAPKREIGAASNANDEKPVEGDDQEAAEDEDSELVGGKTLDEMSEEVPQDIKDKIIDLEAEQQEKLRQTMLRNTFQPKTSALKNL